MKCKGVQPLLSAYLDRELDGNAMLDIRAHLSECDACRAEIENLRNLKRLLGSLDEVEPPEYLEQRLMASVMRERATCGFANPRFAGAMIFAGLALCSMFATLVVLSDTPKPAQAAHSDPSSIPFEIQRDQAFAIGGDPLGGAPIITAATYGGR